MYFLNWRDTRNRVYEKFVLTVLLLGLGGCASGPQTLAPTRATSKPYKIKGQWYHPQPHYEFEEVGEASYYGAGDGTHGCPTASGQRFCMFQLTAAHKTLPLPCMVRVTNLRNGQQLDLKVNDRGPFKYDRVLDVSVEAAKRLGFYRDGLTPVHIKTLVPESCRMAENRKHFEGTLEEMRPAPPITLARSRPVKGAGIHPPGLDLDEIIARSTHMVPTPQESKARRLEDLL